MDRTPDDRESGIPGPPLPHRPGPPPAQSDPSGAPHGQPGPPHGQFGPPGPGQPWQGPPPGPVQQGPPVPVERPRSVTNAVILFVVAAVLWLPIADADPGASQLAGLVLIASIVCAILAGGGRHGARVTVTVLAGLAFLLLAPYAWLGFLDQRNPYGAEYAVMDMIAIAATAAAIVLIYLPTSNAYFRARRAAPTTLGHPGGNG
ncbi:MAG: hypothetical protein GEV11_24585 [Streptosporangiales bacterium]|nr:hypothetical protein [Streptosporangiales bacterium]